MKSRDPVEIDSSSYANKEIEKKDGGFFRKGQFNNMQGLCKRYFHYLVDENLSYTDWFI